ISKEISLGLVSGVMTLSFISSDAWGGIRTHTLLRAQHFKCRAYTIPPPRRDYTFAKKSGSVYRLSPLRDFRKSSTAVVFRTSDLDPHPRRTWATPRSRYWKWWGAWASESTTSFTPSFTASRMWASRRASRSGKAFTSMATPYSLAARRTFRMSTWYGSRLPVGRPGGGGRVKNK